MTQAGPAVMLCRSSRRDQAGRGHVTRTSLAEAKPAAANPVLGTDSAAERHGRPLPVAVHPGLLSSGSCKKNDSLAGQARS